MAFQWQHVVVLVTMLLQRLPKLSQQITVDFPDMNCNGHKDFLEIALQEDLVLSLTGLSQEWRPLC